MKFSNKKLNSENLFPDVAIIVTGPTCSGKSCLAYYLSKFFNGAIINCDSMQVYKDLHILTARPDLDEEKTMPHFLYGIRNAEEPGNVAWWRREAFQALSWCYKNKVLPIFCGGTGMYLRALTDGLVEMPLISQESRKSARSFIEDYGPSLLHKKLQEVDPITAQRLNINDSQRIARAWEVFLETGKGLSYWQRENKLPAAPCHFISIRLDPPRDLLRENISNRFHRMIEKGAIDEVKNLLKKNLSSELPVMRAHGVPEIREFLYGNISIEEAINKAILATGRYTRRQATWFRHHKLADQNYDLILNERYEKNTVEEKGLRARYFLEKCLKEF